MIQVNEWRARVTPDYWRVPLAGIPPAQARMPKVRRGQNNEVDMDKDTPYRQGEGPDNGRVLAAGPAPTLHRRSGLRRATGVGVSAFVGAGLTLVLMLSIPNGWFDAPFGVTRRSLACMGLWTLAIVPALSVVMLGRRRRPGRDVC